MAHITYATHIEFMDQLYQINNGKSLGVYSKDLKKMLQQFEAILSYHNKVLFIRFDLHLKQLTKNNALVSKFINRLKKTIPIEFDLKRHVHIWCREHNKAKAQHYHVVLMVDGNKHQSPHYLIEHCKGVWEGLGQIFSYCWNNERKSRQHLNIKRGSWFDYQEAIYWLSYLAKSNTKSNRLSTTNKYGTSRLKPRKKVG